LAGLRGDFVILGPLPTSGTTEVRKLKFGEWMDYVRYKLAEDKLPPPPTTLGHGQGMVLATSGNRSYWASANIFQFNFIKK